MSQIKYGVVTHIGLVRENNEDNYVASPTLGLWLVADGLGGYECGEVASSIVSDHIIECVRKGISLEASIASSHQAVIEAYLKGKGKRGMGSTVVCTIFTGNTYRTAWVGDSRAYLWNGKHLMQLTHDHSLVQELCDKGIIEKADAYKHPLSNVINQYVGQVNLASLKIDVVEGKLYRGDRILLCSDGLNCDVSDEEIEAIFAKLADEQKTADSLVEAALDNGGADNITVLVISAPDESPPRNTVNNC